MAFELPQSGCLMKMSWRDLLRVLICVFLASIAFFLLSFIVGFIHLSTALVVRITIFWTCFTLSLIGIYVGVVHQKAEVLQRQARIQRMYPAFAAGGGSEDLQDGTSSAQTCVVCLEDTCLGDACRRMNAAMSSMQDALMHGGSALRAACSAAPCAATQHRH
eukprot:CAMPEP_0115198970 /NCGR_PEP_ID=MMETSP0270-20121206/16376_1 /TAXON_ID=71861 /ORGANISM="Scrippsiella trochoidea, Strain CCMP3099" /LENGTH=161 /DNA_ID=CAMNT_0002612351 /DNA_START=238 /DNA_END=724 /DNA_ORIENTATION=-